MDNGFNPFVQVYVSNQSTAITRLMNGIISFNPFIQVYVSNTMINTTLLVTVQRF